jgi:predicted dehydrogenase
LVSEGTIGEPVHLESHYGYNLAGPYGSIIFADKNHWIHGLPGKLFHNNIDHLLYKVTEYLPDESPDVHALGFRRNPESFGDIRDQVFDELRVLIKGERVTAYATLTAHARPVKHSLRIYGTKGTLFADFVSRVVIEEEGQSLPSAIGRILPAFNNGFQFIREGGRNVIRFIRSDFHFFSGLNRLISLFYESIAIGGDVPISYENIMRIVSMSEEIFKKIRGREHA